ncbi:exodeoxyribonuclease VII large subunit [bacterium]|nr:exodeoxyribonuclease VII large subunit [bacterium]
MPKKKIYQSEFPGLFKEAGELSYQDPEEKEPEISSEPEDDPLKPQTVSELTDKLRNLIEENFFDVYVVGEISDFVRQSSSGHFYFSLKDEKTQIGAAMFRGANRRLKFMPENGLLVIVRGKIDIYPPRGQYKIICEDMEPCGLGSKQLQFEQLKRKLEEEGLTSEDRKRPLPVFPKTVGFVTSASGSVLRDVKNVLFRRFPCRLVFAPAVVQGEAAPASIIEAIENCNLYNEQHPETPIDVLIVGRGGGSMEDLWCFNDEGVARAIAASKIPVVSAVGHETDWTIADLVADLRAPTPSAAAEQVVQTREDWECTVDDLYDRLQAGMEETIDDKGKEVLKCLTHYALREPTHIVEVKMQRVDELDDSLRKGTDKLLEGYETRIDHCSEMLSALGPLSVMKRGYAVVQDEAGEAITSAKTLKEKVRFLVRMSDGSVKAKVLDEQ